MRSHRAYCHTPLRRVEGLVIENPPLPAGHHRGADLGEGEVLSLRHVPLGARVSHLLRFFFRPFGFLWCFAASRACFDFARFADRDTALPRVRSRIDSASLIMASDTCWPAGSAGSSPRRLCPARSHAQQVHAAGCTSWFR